MEYAAMGSSLERCRFKFLPEMATARRVLILGEGDGRFLNAFLSTNHQAEIDVVDNSGKMIAFAERRTRSNGGPRVRFHQVDARSWLPPDGANYDLIVTHFFLDCFSDEELAPMMRRFGKAAAAECRWAISEFRQPAHGLFAWRARLWIGALYRLFGWITGLRVRQLPDHRGALEKNGFRRARSVVTDWGLLTAELWERP